MTITTIIFYILLVDAVCACFLSYRGIQGWWQSHLGVWAKHFPLARGWTTYYLILVLFIGWILHQNGELMLPL